MKTIPKDTFPFFKALSNNNNREWFNDNKPKFKAIESEIKNFANALTEQLSAHDTIEKTKVFRIYRDVRFSKNKAPYKTHFGISFHRKKPELRGGYYLHIESGGSFIATGFWQPEKNDLLRIRKELEQDAQEFRDIIENKNFKAIWGNLEGNELKTAPKGFDKTHPDIDLIKKKQYIFTKSFSDKEVLSSNFLNKVDEAYKAVRPYFDYMSDVLTTNLNGESLV